MQCGLFSTGLANDVECLALHLYGILAIALGVVPGGASVVELHCVSVLLVVLALDVLHHAGLIALNF